MSQETYHQILSLNHPELERRLAIQCSPVITGIKPSNLFITPKADAASLASLLKHSNISFFLLAEKEGKATYLLYREEVLMQYLSTAKVNTLLQEFNCLRYTQPHLPKLLTLLKERYEAYVKGNGLFPHEIGLFLGYPPEDVIGYIKNNGKNHLSTGYWKVYENLAEKQQLFSAYEKARETIIGMLFNGVSLRKIICNYHHKHYMMQ